MIPCKDYSTLAIVMDDISVDLIVPRITIELDTVASDVVKVVVSDNFCPTAGIVGIDTLIPLSKADIGKLVAFNDESWTTLLDARLTRIINPVVPNDCIGGI